MPDCSLSIDVEHRFANSGFHVNAKLHAGSGWSVLYGPSSAGKSSLLRAIAGLLVPQRGTINFGGKQWFDSTAKCLVPAHCRDVGYVAQSPALFPNMTVAQNIAFGQRYARIPADVNALSEIFRCAHLLQREPAGLSGGEQQRVALARALAPEPCLLLLDEPFRGLDADLRDTILLDLQAYLEQRPIPVLAVSHDVVEILSLGACVYQMAAGKIVHSGPASEMLREQRQAILRKLSPYSAT